MLLATRSRRLILSVLPKVLGRPACASSRQRSYQALWIERPSIGLEHLPSRLHQGYAPAPAGPFRLPPGGLDLQDVERMLLVQALEQSRHNKSEAARLLGMTRATFRYRLRKYGLDAA